MEDIEEGIQKKLKILSAISRIHQSVGADLDLQKVSDDLVKELKNILGCTGCAILLIDDNNVKIASNIGFSNMFSGKKISADMPAIKYIKEKKRSIKTGDIAHSDFSECIPTGCSMNSLICSPILVNTEVKGIIHIDSLNKNAFDEDDLLFVELLSKEVANVIQRTQLFTKTKELSQRDELTGCFNRRKMEQDLKDEASRASRYNNSFTILMIDCDWFKKYNDYHGHQKGDELLKKLVYLIKRNIRSVDKIYRYGGEEFLILLPMAQKEQGQTLGERLRELVEREDFEGEQESQPEKKVTISIGIANFPQDSKDIISLIKAADSALYSAKEGGRNRVVLYQKN